jgi:hypothetical protein
LLELFSPDQVGLPPRVAATRMPRGNKIVLHTTQKIKRGRPAAPRHVFGEKQSCKPQTHAAWQAGYRSSRRTSSLVDRNTLGFLSRPILLSGSSRISRSDRLLVGWLA